MTKRIPYAVFIAVFLFLSGHIIGPHVVPDAQTVLAEEIDCSAEEFQDDPPPECQDTEFVPTASLACCGTDKMTVEVSGKTECWSCWKIAFTLGVVGGAGSGSLTVGLGIFGFSMMGCVMKC